MSIASNKWVFLDQVQNQIRKKQLQETKIKQVLLYFDWLPIDAKQELLKLLDSIFPFSLFEIIASYSKVHFNCTFCKTALCVCHKTLFLRRPIHIWNNMYFCYGCGEELSGKQKVLECTLLVSWLRENKYKFELVDASSNGLLHRIKFI